MALHRILVVDDDSIFRMDTAETLKEAGFEVIEACDVASALVVLTQDPEVDLVCTDVNMPGELDGIDLAMRVRKRHPTTKVIVMSGCSRRLECPAEVPFLRKPVHSGRLVALAQEELGALVSSV
jgi:DNA-binding NtrC family response regulator